MRTARLAKRVRATRKTPLYNIGTVSRLTGLPVWTLRWIEKHRLVAPHRSGGNRRLFSEDDIVRLHEIRELMEERVNLHGIRVILEMRLGRGQGAAQPLGGSGGRGGPAGFGYL